MVVVAALRQKTCSYLIDDNDENKKQNKTKGTKKCVAKKN